MFIVVTGFTGLNVVNLLNYVLMKNQECKVRPVIMNINSGEPSFYPYSILAKEWSVC